MMPLVRRHGRSLQKKQNLLRSFVKHTPLFLPLNKYIYYAGINNWEMSHKNKFSLYQEERNILKTGKEHLYPQLAFFVYNQYKL